MKEENPLFMKSIDEWRTWLNKNHDKANEIWLTFYKKHTGRECLSLSDSVDEAICFGWIDSTTKRIDEERYIHKFTPRKPKSIWSKINKNKALRMIKKERMTEAGLVKINEAKKNGFWQNPDTHLCLE